jgi:fructokinase
MAAGTLTVACLGEALIDFVADEAGCDLIDCPGFRKAAGGAVANVAVGLARLGVASAFLGKVGDDAFGLFLERTLREAGVDTRGMVFDPDHRTALAFVSLDRNGERKFMFYRNPSADMLHRAEEVPDSLLVGTKAFHFGSITLIQEPSRTATLDALARSKEQGAIISYDPNLREPLWPSLEEARAGILAALPHVDIVKVSEEEAEFLFGPGSSAQQAARLHAQGALLVAITRGARGSFLSTLDRQAEAAPYKVEVVDTTGAGDAFLAALLKGVLVGNLLDAGERLGELGRIANAAGALTCLKKGAIPALPTADELADFMKQQAD